MNRETVKIWTISGIVWGVVYWGLFLIGIGNAERILTPQVHTADSGGIERTIHRGGTGILEEIPPGSGRFQVVAPNSVALELGTVDAQTEVQNFANDATFSGIHVRKFVGKHMTVIAEIDVRIENENVFVPIRTRRLRVQTGTEVLP